ncbi:MAG: hypothetical protein PHT69_03720 [Bacteroidales bacterium]|nr:hypothetical protein [Bacteroidales bacterium]
MKKTIILSACLMLVVFLFSCKKDTDQTPAPKPKPNPTINYNAGLGNTPGYPSGIQYELPSYVEIIGEIRGGTPNKANYIDKDTYQGPFPTGLVPKSWISYGTGTYVDLYITFFNTLGTNATLTLPGGLIFCDTLDTDSTNGMYQRGLILQPVNIFLPALDTAFAHLRAYCLNHNLAPSNYNSVYYIGPVTNNPELNQMVTIMNPKQYPFGEEYSLQTIIWNITDYAQTLTSQEIQYLNSLP